MHCCLNMKLLTEGTCNTHQYDLLRNCLILRKNMPNLSWKSVTQKQQDTFYIGDLQPGTKVSDFVAANHQ